ncbi:hypothetical protein D3C72_829270 [compost metagenome]
MPRDAVISRLLAPARSIMPSRVREITQYSSSATAMPTAEMNSRYTGYVITPPSEILPCSHAGSGTPCTSLPTRMLRSSSKTKISP